MEHQLDRREFLKKLVGVGALYTTGAAGLLLPKDVVAATSMADFWSRDRTINCNQRISKNARLSWLVFVQVIFNL